MIFKRNDLGLVRCQGGPLLLLQLFDSPRRLRQQLTLVRQRFLERLVLHFELNVGLDDVGRVAPAQRLAHPLLEEEHAELEVEILMLKLLELLLVLFHAAAPQWRRFTRRSIHF